MTGEGGGEVESRICISDKFSILNEGLGDTAVLRPLEYVFQGTTLLFSQSLIESLI